MKLSISNLPSLPEPSNLSPSQIGVVIGWYATLPLKELRYRQHLCYQQLQRASSVSNPSIRLHATQNLQATAEHLAAAVDLQQFGI